MLAKFIFPLKGLQHLFSARFNPIGFSNASDFLSNNSQNLTWDLLLNLHTETASHKAFHYKFDL